VEGGWYAVVRVPATRPTDDLAIELLKSEAISVQPGHFYELPSEGYLVVSLLTNESEFSRGVAGLLASIG